MHVLYLNSVHFLKVCKYFTALLTHRETVDIEMHQIRWLPGLGTQASMVTSLMPG